MKIRFTEYETEDGARSVCDIIELDSKVHSRTKMMKQFGQWLDRVLNDDRWADALMVEKDK